MRMPALYSTAIASVLGATVALAHPHLNKTVTAVLPQGPEVTITYNTTPANELHAQNAKVGEFVTPRRPVLKLSAELKTDKATLAAGAAAFIGVPVGWILVRTRSAWTSLLDVTATLPFAVAGTILAIGLVIAFNSGGLVLTGGWLIMVLAYTVRKLPFTVRASSAILHQIDPSLEEASISLGVSPLRTLLRLVVPLMLGGIVSGMVLTWVTVASELSSTVVLYSGPWRTLTIVMFQALEGTGAGVAVAAASLLIAITLIPVLAAYQLLRRYELSML